MQMNHQVTLHTDLERAFQEADVVLLLDDFSLRTEEEEKTAKEMSGRYGKYGQLIDERASKRVKVIVSGESSNLRCSLLAGNARSINSSRFVVATATQLEDEARAIIAKEMEVRPSGIHVEFSCLVVVAAAPQIYYYFVRRCQRCVRVGEHQWSFLHRPGEVEGFQPPRRRHRTPFLFPVSSGAFTRQVHHTQWFQFIFCFDPTSSTSAINNLPTRGDSGVAFSRCKR